MANGLWVSVSGAAAQAQSVDSVANNLANVDTTGYKKDQPTFKEYLSTVEREPTGVDIPRGPIKDRELYPLDGKDQGFVVVDGTYTNFKSGNLKVTQQPLDLAMDGPGFLEVNTPVGVRFTRAGNLKVATDGRLVTTQGFPVLSAQPQGLAAQTIPGTLGQTPTTASVEAQAAAVAARFINLKDAGPQISIGPSGEIYSGDRLIAKLSVVEFQDQNKLRKQGASVFENMDPANAIEPKKTVVRQGMIETSNVNPVEEMTNLIKANRLFEQDMKAMKTFGDMMGREANDIGKL